jgi:hypothetical protein
MAALVTLVKATTLLSLLALFAWLLSSSALREFGQTMLDTVSWNAGYNSDGPVFNPPKATKADLIQSTRGLLPAIALTIGTSVLIFCCFRRFSEFTSRMKTATLALTLLTVLLWIPTGSVLLVIVVA